MSIHLAIWSHAQGSPVIDLSAPVCCAPVAAGPVGDAAAFEVALRLKALADPASVKLMSLLFSSPAGEENSGALSTAVDLTESTVSHHLTQLRKAGLVALGPARNERLPPRPQGRTGRALRCAGPELLQLARALASFRGYRRQYCEAPVRMPEGRQL